MTQVAGHPIAIRVGGRRMSQSSTSRSPTKAQQSNACPNTTFEAGAGVDNTAAAAEPDYPRPRSPVKTAATTKDAANAAEEKVEDSPASAEQEGTNNNGNGSGNRQERRRQERRREKNEQQKDQNGNGGGKVLQQMQKDALFNHLRKGSVNGERGNRQANGGANGVRITQPAQKMVF